MVSRASGRKQGPPCCLSLLREAPRAQTGVQQFSSAQSLSHVQLFATAWTAACQASLSITNSRSLLKLMSIELVMPSHHLILFASFSSCPQSFPVSGSFPRSQLFTSGGQSIGASTSASVIPKNIQSWFPLGLTGLISTHRNEITWDTTSESNMEMIEEGAD